MVAGFRESFQFSLVSSRRKQRPAPSGRIGRNRFTRPEAAQISKWESFRSASFAARGSAVSNFPRGSELLIDLIGLVFSVLRIQAIAQSHEGTSIARILIKVGTKNLLGFGQ